jgi:hypothetical protein
MAEATADDKSQEFGKLIRDMTTDMLNTFPELASTLDPHLRNIATTKDSDFPQEDVQAVTDYCRTVYPERFFDILYENEDVFGQESEANVAFLPGIDFKPLWAENLTEGTRKTIWKYLKLVLFSTISGVSDQQSFGDTAKLFEAIGEDEFKSKLEDTMKEMQEMLEANQQQDGDGEGPTMSPGNLPSAQSIHDHVAGMMEGKLGTLAREIAEETARDMQVDLEDATTANDVFKKLFKDPSSLMRLVKSVGSKLDAKLKSGEIKESELLAEAQELMQKMKDMPGGGNLQGLLGKMGMGGSKLNTGAMQAHLERQMKLAQTREKLRSKVGARQESARPTLTPEEMAAAEAAAKKAEQELLESLDAENYVFRSGGGAERSGKSDKPGQADKKKKKKKKSKK